MDVCLIAEHHRTLGIGGENFYQRTQSRFAPCCVRIRVRSNRATMIEDTRLPTRQQQAKRRCL
jgi:hypothetical protein